MKTKPDNVANTGQIICRLSVLGQCRLKSNQEKNAFDITISASVFIARKSVYSLNIPLKDKFMPCKSLDKISEALDYLILSDTSFS